MTEEKITEMLLMKESLAEDVRALTYKVADLTETVEILKRIIAAEQFIFFLTIYMPDGNIRYSEKQRGYVIWLKLPRKR